MFWPVLGFFPVLPTLTALFWSVLSFTGFLPSFTVLFWVSTDLCGSRRIFTGFHRVSAGLIGFHWLLTEREQLVKGTSRSITNAAVFGGTFTPERKLSFFSYLVLPSCSGVRIVCFLFVFCLFCFFWQTSLSEVREKQWRTGNAASSFAFGRPSPLDGRVHAKYQMKEREENDLKKKRNPSRESR